MTTLEARDETVETKLFSFDELALWIDPTISEDDWRSIAAPISRLAQGWQFYVGDWYLHGENRYGDSIAVQYVDELGLALKTVQNAAWVCSRFPVDHRRKELDFGHHDAAAGLLEQADRDEMLEKSVAEGWTVKQVREAVRLKKAKPQSERIPGTEDDDEDPYDLAAELADLRYLRERCETLLADDVSEAHGRLTERLAHVQDPNLARFPRWTVNDVHDAEKMVRSIRWILGAKDAIEKGAVSS